MFSCEFCETSNNTFSYKTPPVATSGKIKKNVLPNITFILNARSESGIIFCLNALDF